jgi:hypothetical protein
MTYFGLAIFILSLRGGGWSAAPAGLAGLAGAGLSGAAIGGLLSVDARATAVPAGSITLSCVDLRRRGWAGGGRETAVNRGRECV